MKSKTLLKIAKENQRQVKKWPKWMQKITITAKTCASGQFIEVSK